MKKIDKATLERLKGENGELYAVSAGDVELIVRPPSREAFRRFTKRSANDAIVASEELIRDCVVWPSADELDAVLTRRPGLVLPISENLLRIAGALQEVNFRAL